MNLFGRLAYTGSCLFELARGILLVGVVLTLIHLFIATVFIVEGVSMEPNFHTGELVVVDRATYQFGTPSRGDVVVLRFPGDPDHRKYVKRLLALPGETIAIREGGVYVNDERLSEPYLDTDELTYETLPNKASWTLGDDEYFLIGDNRDNSSDSRTWGPASRRFLIGRAVLIAWPFSDLGLVPQEQYEIQN